MGTYLGCEHTQANFKDAFWRSEVLDYKPFETWLEDGAKDTMSLSADRVKVQLSNYQKPLIDIAIEEALNEYVTKKKASVPDSFV